MKVQIEVLDDQLELLKKIQSLPKIISDHLGKFPQAFTNPFYETSKIDDAVANLEFKCKKMIFDTCIVKDKLEEIFKGLNVSNKPVDLYGDD